MVRARRKIVGTAGMTSVSHSYESGIQKVRGILILLQAKHKNDQQLLEPAKSATITNILGFYGGLKAKDFGVQKYLKICLHTGPVQEYHCQFKSQVTCKTLIVLCVIATRYYDDSGKEEP